MANPEYSRPQEGDDSFVTQMREILGYGEGTNTDGLRDWMGPVDPSLVKWIVDEMTLDSCTLHIYLTRYHVGSNRHG